MKRLVLALALVVASISSLRADATVVFNEIMYHPVTNEPAMEWVELYNQLAVDMDISGWSLAGEIGYTFPVNTRIAGRSFVIVAINPAALMAITGLTNVVGPFTNRLSNDGGTLVLKNNNGRIMDRLTYGTEGEWPVAPDGAGPSLAKIDEDAGSAEPANWRASKRIGGNPGIVNQPRTTYTTTTSNILPLDSTWRYNQSGNDLGTEWKGAEYSDAGWSMGQGVFGLEDNATVMALTNTTLSLTNPSGQRVITYYFRTYFNYTNNPATASLSAANLLDDGVVVYLNGTEIYRYRVPTGQDSQTLAQNQPSEGVFETMAFSSAQLLGGENVLAAEVHQVNTGSTDVVFGLRLDEVTTTTNLPPESAAEIPVAFNEISSVTNAQFWIELVNTSTQSVSLENCVLARFGTVNREYLIPALTIAPGEYLVLDRATLGFGADPGDRVVLYAPGKAGVIDAIVAKSYPRARLAEGNGDWMHPGAGTPGATNFVALHDEIVINEIMYNHKRFPSVNGLPPEENPEEWIELYNRSTNIVDLTGWALDGAISYRFPTGKTIQPGAYLVVAKDAAALRVNYPGSDILGNYSGRLGSRGEVIHLEDSLENVADEVRFYSSGRWPEYAAGGGSSLELRDPNADNSKPEAWAASDESIKSGWQTCSYRMVAQPSLTPNADGQWREFLLGLLSGGECLVDDIQVLQSPTNNPVSLIQNGDFESGLAGWRVLGTHGSSKVIAEPGNPGNHVLQVIATGPQEHMHNHIVTTLANGLSVANGQLYEISYRAKWVAGKSLLNTRLWFNRVARTTELAVPQLNGTPGTRNGAYQPNIGPTFAGFQHQPVVPAAGTPVTVSVQAADPDGVTNSVVFWSVSGGAFSSAPMVLKPDGTHVGTIPGNPAGTIVQFYVQAQDGKGAIAMFPARGPNSGALYKVNDGQANVSLQHNIRIITTPAHAALLHADTNVMSNDNLPATVIYDERIVYYDVGVRLKSSMNGRPYSSRVGFHLSFPPDKLFRGVHPAIGLDRRSGDSSPANEEIVVRHIALAAGGIPTMYLDVARVLSPRGTENGPALCTPSHEDDFIETAFENGGEGVLYEMEGTYYSTTANAYGYKLPQPNATQYADMADRGNDKEVYRYHYIRKNHHDEDNYVPLMTLCKAFGLNGTALETQTQQLMDMDEWLRAYAVITLCGVNDTYTFWLQHNMMMYFRPTDNKAVYLMWDNDFSFTRSSTSAIVGDQNLGKIINLPSNLRVLYAHMLDLIDTKYNANYLGYWLSHYAPFSGTTYNRLSYIQERTDYVKGVISGAGGNTPFSVSNTNITVMGSNLVTLSGSAPVIVRTVTVNGVPWPVTWTSLTGWTLRVPLDLATNTLEIAGLDLRGNPVPNASVNATAIVNAVPESPVGQVVFNEFMFHAAVEGGEYVELYNRSGTTTFDLSGWEINGLGYTFPAGSYISPRSYLVLAKNRTVFAATYGGGAGLFDQFNGELQLDGETLTLIRRGAAADEDLVVDKVRYEGAEPWPAAAANGTGSSYQLTDGSQDNSRAGNWKAGYVPAVYEGGISTPASTNDGWRFVSYTGSIGNGVGSGQQRLLIYLGQTNGASAIIDDISLVEGTTAATGYNYLRNGDFESGPLIDSPALTNSWLVPANYQNSSIVGSLTHSGAGALRLQCTTFGNIFGKVISQNLSPAPLPNTVCTLSFWFWSTNSATNLFVRIQNSAALTTGLSGTNILPVITLSNYIPPTLVSPATNYLTPGAANQMIATLPAFPTLWINEIQAAHATGPADNHGELDPWIEVYNSGTNAVSLDGLYLSSTYTNLTNWAFPAGQSIGAQQFLIIFCDGHPSQTATAELHTSFRLQPNRGSVALSRLFNGEPQVIDYVNYGGLDEDRSYGSFPDGQPFDRQEMYYVTPGSTNDGRSAPLTVFINEWMAGNARALADPADTDCDDWFELYNPSTNEVDIAGYFLTDTLTNKFKYGVTTNGPHVIPPHGYLLVWADNETGQNMSASGPRSDLHVSFQLSLGGEAIGLFAADGTPIDAITFTQQTNDVSMGRYPDGSSSMVFMPGSASPRAANFLASANTPPVLNPIGGRSGYVGVTLGFTAIATDSDLPAQSLTFTLGSGTPAGASITPGGIFTWTPTATGTFQIIVRVTDSGVPALNDEETITVIVQEPLRVGGALLAGNNLELRWSTQPGQCYALDFKEDLNAPAWIPVLTNRALGDSLSFTNSITNATQRFFRIRTVQNCGE